MIRFIKFTLLTLVFISAALYSSEVRATPSLGDFKCPMFAGQDKKLSIFLLTNVEGDDKLVEEPVGNNFFCVETLKTASTASWAELTQGRNQNGAIAIHAQWGGTGADARPQSFAQCALQMVPYWQDSGSDKRPQDIKYPLSATGPFCSQSDRRLRYYLNELVGSPELYLYYVKEASSSEQQDNPIPICAQKDGTSKSVCEAVSGCLWRVDGAKCLAKADPGIDCTKLTPTECSAANYCTHEEKDNKCVKKAVNIEVDKAIDKYIADRYGMPKGYEGPLPECAFTGSCRKVEDLVQLGVNVANWLFGIIAGLGFAFFVYGGLTMVLSFGNSEKVGQGKQILVAATVGMIIAFSAYILVSFIVKAIGITP